MSIRKRSGEINTYDPLTVFFYLLMRDHVCAGKIEALVKEIEGINSEVQFSNGWLAQHAQDIAVRLDNHKLHNVQHNNSEL